ncbi:hypothetical protein Nmel_003633 [Mimus melanotis]
MGGSPCPKGKSPWFGCRGVEITGNIQETGERTLKWRREETRLVGEGYRMGILVRVDKREGLTGFCGWQGSGITWRMGKNPKLLSRGRERSPRYLGGGESLQNSRGREGPGGLRGCPEPRGGGGHVRAPSHAGARRDRPGRCHGDRAPLEFGGGGRWGGGHAGHARRRHWPARRGRHGNRAWRGGSAPRKRSHGGGGGGGGSVADAADGGGAGDGRRLGLGATAQQVRGQSRVGHDGHLLPGAVSSVFAVQAHVELDSKEKIKQNREFFTKLSLPGKQRWRF